MVGSDNESEESNGYYSPDYPHIAKRFLFAGVVGHNVGDHAESGEDKNVYFRVSEESEKMLVKNRVSPSCRVKEGGVEVTVREKHGDSGS